MTETAAVPSSHLHTGSHDLPVSPALRDFMTHGWTPGPPAPELRMADEDLLAARRARLSARFPGERLIIPAGRLAIRSNDTGYRFRPHTAYAWLTGFTGEDQAGHVLLMEPAGGTHQSVLHIRPRSSRDGEEFYRDRRHGEFWVGRRPDVDEVAALSGLRCEHVDRLAGPLGGPAPSTRLLAGVDPHVDELAGTAVRTPAGDAELAAALAELRLVKEPWEIAQLRLAVEHTVAGFEDVVRALPDALEVPRGERWVEGVFGLRARAEGNGVGYETIAAAGAHASVLHWTRNDGPLRRGELLLLDAGVETDTLYTADITRTLPLSGRFSFVQSMAYDLVLAAQTEAIATLRPGMRFRDFHRAAMGVIVEGLHDWGVLKVSPEEAMDPASGVYRRWTLCSSGHMLGMDVHDCAAARAETYLDAVLEEGHVLTVEPGLYFQPDDDLVPAELRGMGMRIEDDLVVTATGAELLSAGLARSAHGVEEWMGSLLND